MGCVLLDSQMNAAAFQSLFAAMQRSCPRSADGAYDTRRCHDAIAERGANAVIPPRKTATPWTPSSAGAVASVAISRSCPLATMERIPPPEPCRDEDALRQAAGLKPNGTGLRPSASPSLRPRDEPVRGKETYDPHPIRATESLCAAEIRKRFEFNAAQRAARPSLESPAANRTRPTSCIVRLRLLAARRVSEPQVRSCAGDRRLRAKPARSWVSSTTTEREPPASVSGSGRPRTLHGRARRLAPPRAT